MTPHPTERPKSGQTSRFQNDLVKGVSLKKVLFALLLCFPLLQGGNASKAQKTARAEAGFDAALTRTAQGFLDERAKTVEKITTREQAETRKTAFRAFVLRSIGGLPDVRTPLDAKLVGTLRGEGFTVERIIYDSLPGFHITANLYLPTASERPSPAVLFTPGHYPFGKLEAWEFGTNLARHGVAVLTYDPIGEGERLQYFDAATAKSLAGPPTGEHTEASVQIALTGDHIARYFIWDAMRGIDYLQSRPEIDASRIGALGCSGGGAVTTFLAAIDSRVKAAGSACYITGFHELLNTIGPQEAEQTIPGFIQQGLDFPDWIEAAAPTPYAVISTTEDMFPFEGARRSFDEAKRTYGLYGANDRIQWITGPGRHGNLRPIEPEIMSFFLHWLKGTNEKPELVRVNPPPAKALECTSTGQVANSIGGETLFTLNRSAAQKLVRAQPTLRNAAELKAFQTNLREQVRQLTGTTAAVDARIAEPAVVESTHRTGYTLERVMFDSASGIRLSGALAIPEGAQKKPAVLLLDESADTLEGSQLDKLARAGNVVFAPELPPGEKDPVAPKSPLLGPFYLASLRAEIVGQTLVGLRVDDAIRCLNWLASRSDVNASRISGYAKGSMGIVLLHAAVLDTRLREITLEGSLLTYRLALEASVTRNLAQSVVPGVLRSYDLDDLIATIAPQRVTLIAPLDGAGAPMKRQDAENELAWVMNVDRTLKRPAHVQLLWPLPESGPSSGKMEDVPH